MLRLSRLPSALALAALFALPTSSSAQTYGMTALARPGTTQTTYREFDWTGLTYSFSYLLVGNETIHPDGSLSNLYGGMGNFSEAYYDFGIDFNNSNAAIIEQSGTSTYKWRWLVPSVIDANGMETGAPDLANFPVPTMFMLGHIDSGIQADWISQVNNTTWGDGILYDQWNIATGQLIPRTQMFYGPVPPTQSADNTAMDSGLGTIRTAPIALNSDIVQGLLKPTAYVEGYANAPSTPANDIELLITCAEHAFALELCDTKTVNLATNGGATTLDLFGYAEKRGDGKNQFVYGTDGLLYIPMGVKLKGAPNDVTARDTSWVKRYAVDWKTNINTTPTMNAVATKLFPHNIIDSFTDRTLDPDVVAANVFFNNGISYNGLVYHDLPSKNDDFGKGIVKDASGKDVPGSLVVTLIVKDTINKNKPVDTEIAHIQTFFKGTDTTHPSATQYEQTLPNWFYYYSQRYLPTNQMGTITYSPPSEATPEHPGSWYDPFSGNIKISNNAFPGTRRTRLHVFTIKNSTVTWAGDLELRGILAYIAEVGHEEGHYTLAHTPTGDGLHTIEADNPTTDPATGISSDSNNDGLDDAWEANHHFGPVSGAHSFNVTGLPDLAIVDVHKDNRECLCDILALGEVVRLKSEGRNDWAKEGMQFGIMPPLPNSVVKFFSWTFYPRLGTTDSVDENAGTDQLPSGYLSALKDL